MRGPVKAAWETLPKPVKDVIAMTVDSVKGVQLEQLPVVDQSAARRLFVAPANYAGQGYRWARAAESAGDVSAANMVYAEINPFGYKADQSSRGRTVTHSWKWQRRQLAFVTSTFTHVLIEAEMPPLGGIWHENVRRQVRALQGAGIVVGAVCHGSDIRLPSRHRELEQHSPFHPREWPNVPELERVASTNRLLLDDLDLPTFVSTPGLLLDVPYAHLLPIVIDSAPWSSGAAVLERKRPRIVHVPSNALLKGTAQIEKSLRGLHDEGLIEYMTIEGRSQDEMPAIYRDADIVLDQFRLGDYGAAACEAMAAGRLVISHVSEQVRAEVHRVSGLILPIMEADIDSIESVLRLVLNQRANARAIAARGPDFVSAMHDGSRARTILNANFLDVTAQ